MSVRTVVVALLALVCGASATVGVHKIVTQRRTQVTAESVNVLVAATELARGSVLSKTSIKLQAWPKNLVPTGALHDLSDVTDRTVVTRVFPGDPILESKLAASDTGPGLASMIPQGMRAFTVRTVNVASGVAGFILPGNRVDILLTTTGSSAGEASGGAATTTLLQNIEILAVDQWLDAPEDNKVDPKALKSVTLLVTPDQAAKLGLGTNKGILQLSLRRPEDHSEADTLPATMADIRYQQQPPLPPVTQVAAVEEIEPEELEPEVEDDAPLSILPPSPPRFSQIQTLRGSHRGTLRILGAKPPQESLR